MAGVDLSVPVAAKMCAHHLTELADLGVEGLDDGDLAGHDGRVGGLDHRRLAQRFGVQHRLQPGGLVVDVAAVGPPQRGADRRPAQLGGLVGVGSAAQQLERVRGVQIGKRLQRGGEELPQRRPQSQHVTGAVPDQALVAAGGQLDRLTLVAVTGQRPMVCPVQAHDLGQHVRVRAVGLRARGGMPFPVAGHRHRVDRKHLVAGGDQRATHGPRSVSMPTFTMPATCAGSQSAHPSGRCSPIRACNTAIPSSPLGSRRRASTRPSSSTTSTS